MWRSCHLQWKRSTFISQLFIGRLWESNPRPPALQFLNLDTELHFVIQLRNTLKIIHEIFYFHFWLIFKTNKKTKILNVHFIQMNTSRNHVSDELRLKFNDSKGTANKWIWSAKITLGKKYKPRSKCFLCTPTQSYNLSLCLLFTRVRDVHAYHMKKLPLMMRWLSS